MAGMTWAAVRYPETRSRCSTPFCATITGTPDPARAPSHCEVEAVWWALTARTAPFKPERSSGLQVCETVHDAAAPPSCTVIRSSGVLPPQTRMPCPERASAEAIESPTAPAPISATSPVCVSPTTVTPVRPSPFGGTHSMRMYIGKNMSKAVESALEFLADGRDWWKDLRHG